MDFIFKELEDAIWLHEYFIKRDKTVWFHETIFQNQKQYFLSIDINLLSNTDIQEGFIQFILLKKRLDWVRDILNEYFYYKEESEQNNILDIVIEMFNGEREELTNIIGVINDEEMIQEAVFSLLEQHESVSFDSLLKFRLKAYFERLIHYVEMAIDEYKMEQEYQVFVQMLRDYLAKREPKMKIVRIYFEGYGKFFDEHFKEITKKDMNELMDRRLLTNHPVYIDSVTIAPLLSIAPTMIYVYIDSEENGLIRTLRNIFEERIILLKKEQFARDKQIVMKNTINQ
ncbi:putative sporulation protein YtxC [Heyndrickxia vini]|uniref:Sporulation protein YtxC n=1 Tax=Heyndrickxia vini TaxID=1476025 RepID=A0ABX7E4I7_9BACI|nr:putative sporulation protein YtxC [Heyndrickxia vini]QQZ10643.1 putative sporulation protein YtxC [Heyndrickxia vini]